MSGAVMQKPRLPGPALLLALAIGGCTVGSTDDLKQWVEQVRNSQHTRIEPLPEFKPYETFIYQAQDLRDPFTPSAEGSVTPLPGAQQGSGIHPDANRPREPLEEYPLDTLRMVGTLEKDGQTWALVRAPDGTIHRVRPGNYLGQNHGKIARITEYEIELTEIIPDGLGGWMERTASLALSE